MWEWSAAYCALAALGFTDDPARPLQTLEFLGILPARIQNAFMQAQNNALTNSGFAIQATAPDGNPMILREQTQYQLNSFGQGDTAFGLLTVLATLQELLRRMKAAITTKYPRVKLVPDGTVVADVRSIRYKLETRSVSIYQMDREYPDYDAEDYDYDLADEDEDDD